MLAVIAAMIRIASSPSRNTIIAAFVITVVLLAPSPVFARASFNASSRTRRSRGFSKAAGPGDLLGEPSTPRAPYHMSPSTSVTRAGSNARSLISGPNSKNA